MNRHDVAVLTLRAFGVFAWLKALEFFTTGTVSVLFQNIYQPESSGFPFGRILVTFGPSAIFFVVGGFLFVRSQEFAAALLPQPSDPAPEPLPAHPLAAASVAFAVVGVAVFLHAAPNLLAYAVTLAGIEDTKERMLYFRTHAPQIVAIALQLLLGFVLFLKARTFATAWWRKQQPKGE